MSYHVQFVSTYNVPVLSKSYSYTVRGKLIHHISHHMVKQIFKSKFKKKFLVSFNFRNDILRPYRS